MPWCPCPYRNEHTGLMLWIAKTMKTRSGVHTKTKTLVRRTTLSCKIWSVPQIKNMFLHRCDDIMSGFEALTICLLAFTKICHIWPHAVRVIFLIRISWLFSFLVFFFFILPFDFNNWNPFEDLQWSVANCNPFFLPKNITKSKFNILSHPVLKIPPIRWFLNIVI